MKNLIFLTFLLLSAPLFGQITATYDEVINKKKKGQIDSYITQKGEKFSVGDTINLGVAFRNEQFDFIKQNAGVQVFPLTNVAANSKVKIKKIVLRAKTVIVNTTKPQGYVYGLTIVNFESAIINGEVKSQILSSDQALEELKKWKDKLDLELITQKEYEAKKTELSKFIN